MLNIGTVVKVNGVFGECLQYEMDFIQRLEVHKDYHEIPVVLLNGEIKDYETKDCKFFQSWKDVDEFIPVEVMLPPFDQDVIIRHIDYNGIERICQGSLYKIEEYGSSKRIVFQVATAQLDYDEIAGVTHWTNLPKFNK